MKYYNFNCTKCETERQFYICKTHITKGCRLRCCSCGQPRLRWQNMKPLEDRDVN